MKVDDVGAAFEWVLQYILADLCTTAGLCNGFAIIIIIIKLYHN